MISHSGDKFSCAKLKKLTHTRHTANYKRIHVECATFNSLTRAAQRATKTSKHLASTHNCGCTTTTLLLSISLRQSILVYAVQSARNIYGSDKVAIK